MKHSGHEEFLRATPVIDHDHPAVRRQALALAKGCTGDVEVARSCFTFVRDEIHHSWDSKENPVTLSASAVLEHKTGYCFAKSHLLAALLRANAIPAGFCYQRLKNHSDVGPAYYLHGFNAVWLEEYGWYRADARGNRAGVNAAFTPPDEQLAFVPTEPGEADLAGIFSDPLPEVVHLLSTSADFLDVRRNLTDPGE
ncbi:transglutaminase family protein [Methanoregula sp.]|uniref:transglutaminase-like domain-containing protein n=1 Tax=Methanoregula sp. TaxID=2052170 RepID=UPI002C0F1EE9|nr:transglutaminase family protein [Methanoregula sp.]HVP96296.1 transglutaminase family protein [Methanoregula sp.]